MLARARMMRGFGWLAIAVLVAACACKQNPGTGGGTGTGTGTGDGPGTASGNPEDCGSLSSHVADLYQASAERTKMTPEEVADNTAMVLAECRTRPDRIAGCARKATSVAQLESCLPPLDEDGSEGLQFQNK
jgi:hypothetical protein